VESGFCSEVTRSGDAKRVGRRSAKSSVKCILWMGIWMGAMGKVRNGRKFIVGGAGN